MDSHIQPYFHNRSNILSVQIEVKFFLRNTIFMQHIQCSGKQGSPLKVCNDLFYFKWMDAGEVVCPKKEFTASAPGRRVPTLCEDKVSANTASSVPNTSEFHSGQRVVNKTISDGGITVDFSIIKVHTSNWSSNSWGSSNTWGSSNSSCWDHRIVGDHQIPLDL